MVQALPSGNSTHHHMGVVNVPVYLNCCSWGRWPCRRRSPARGSACFGGPLRLPAGGVPVHRQSAPGDGCRRAGAVASRGLCRPADRHRPAASGCHWRPGSRSRCGHPAGGAGADDLRPAAQADGRSGQCADPGPALGPHAGPAEGPRRCCVAHSAVRHIYICVPGLAGQAQDAPAIRPMCPCRPAQFR